MSLGRKRTANRIRVFWAGFKYRLPLIGKLAVGLLVMLVCAVPAMFLNNYAGYFVILSELMLVIIAGVYMTCLRRFIVYADESKFSSCQRETEMAFQIRIKNRSILVYPRIDLRIILSGPFEGGDSETETSITLAPFEERVFTFDVRFDHLGQHRVGLDRIEIFGPLGVLSTKLPGGTYHTVEVTPRVWNMESLSLSEEVNSENSKAKHSANIDGMDYSGIRQYVVGDPIKNIHWKLSAHVLDYVTKQTEIFGNTGLTVVLDLCCVGKYEAETLMCMMDTLVETAAAVCNYARQIGMDCRILYIDSDGNERNLHCLNNDDFTELVHRIPALKNSRADYDVDKLLEQAAGLHGQNNIVLCTSYADEQMMIRLRQVKYRGFNPLIFFVLPKDAGEKESEKLTDPLRTLDGSEIGCFTIVTAHELERGDF